LLYADTTTTLAKLPDVATGNALISGGVSTAPSWGKIGLTTHVSGTLQVGNGGTGLTSGTSGGIPYYSSTSAMTSSALLGANALMIGGGAGAAPATITTGTGVVTALGVNVGTAGAFVVNGGALGTPSSGTVTNLTGTASININGTVGATTANTGAFTTVTASGLIRGNANIVSRADGGYVAAVKTDGTFVVAITSFLGAFGFGSADNAVVSATSATMGMHVGGSSTAIGTFSSTGLAVTGTISATSDLLVGTTSALGSGKVGFLQSASGQVLTMQNSNATPYGIVCAYTGAAPNSTISQFIYCDDTVGLKMEVRSNGGIANYAANNVILSDRREKTNFAPAGSYLDKICAIPVQTFNYIDQNMEEDGGLTLGVVAQDVQAVAPELVTEGNWGSKDEPKMRFEIYQTDMQYALMKCIQEQQALIESLTTRLTALESK